MKRSMLYKLFSGGGAALFLILYAVSSLVNSPSSSCVMGISCATIENPFLLDAHFALVNIFVAWQDGFPATYAEQIKKQGKILMITWEPYFPEHSKKSILRDIANGKYDELIISFCAAAKAHGAIIFLRLGHEMNGNWYPWASNPELYKKAYLRVFRMFREEQCSNVKFIFSVNNFDVSRVRKFELYYPGDEAVDLMGIDGYNWGNTHPGMKWQSPSAVFSQCYSRVRSLAPDKPVFITEVGSSSSGGDKVQWIRAFFSLLKKRYHMVRAVVWFDIDKETDWSISNNPAAWEVYLDELKDPYFTTDAESIAVTLQY